MLTRSICFEKNHLRYSLFYSRTKCQGASRQNVGNVLIGAGAPFVKLGLADRLYLSELLGATIMFIGFLQATAHPPSQAPAMQPAQS